MIFLGLIVALTTVYAQEPSKKASSYSPVVIKEDFGTIMAHMMAQKAEVMDRQMDLLIERYDLTNRVAFERAL